MVPILPRTIELRQRFPVLARAGVAAERIPAHRGEAGPGHGHDVIELGLILGGTGLHLLDRDETAVVPGSLVIVGFGEAHRFRTPDGPLDILNAYLDPVAVAPPAVDVPGDVGALFPLHPNLLHRRNRVSYLSVGEDAAAALTGLAAETGRGEAASTTALRAWYRLLLTACLRRLPPELSAPGTAMEELRLHLDRHAAEAQSLPQLARHWRMTVPALCRAFKRHTGRSVVGYLHQRRIERSLRLLTDERLSVAAVAAAVGFGTPSHFHRVFRRLVGTSPGRWRAERRDDPGAAPGGS